VWLTAEHARNGLLHQIMQADDLVIMSDSMENLCKKICKLKDTLIAQEGEIYDRRNKTDKSFQVE